jgi:outer membrane protein assembly factor BamB
MRFAKRLAAIAFTGFIASASSSALADLPKETKDWPSFHGSAHDNISHETGLLKDWPQGGPPMVWKIRGIGEGHSSVSVANGKIFTAGSDGNTTYVFALNESDGQQAWKAKVGDNWKNDQGGPGPRSTPTADGEAVYFVSPVGDLVALNAADGQELWRANYQKDFGGRPPGWGFSESLLVDGDNVICTPGGSRGAVIALNRKTGKQIWRSKDFKDAAAYAPPLPADIGGVHQIITYTESHVAGVDAKDGALLWSADRKGKTATIPTPVVKDNYVYVTSGYGVGCDLFKINANDGKFSVEPVYTHDDNRNMVNHHGGVILIGDCVYGHSDGGTGWTCQDLVSGQIKWKNKNIGKGSIAYADGRFYLREENGRGSKIALIEASPEGYKEHGRFEQPEHSGKSAWPHPVIANGKLYLRDQDLLFCYDVKAK